MRYLLLLSAFLVHNAALGVPAPSNTCSAQLKNAGLSDSYAFMIVHGVHSMALEDLKLFDPKATENNFVPTIDLNLKSDQAVLSHAPSRKTKDSDAFLTDGMKTLDSVLSHMGEKHWDIQAFSTLEKVAHAFHMREGWARIKTAFDQIGKSVPAPSSEVCQCVMDVENNGVMDVLAQIAMIFREPSLVSQGDPRFTKKENVPYVIPYAAYSNHAAQENKAVAASPAKSHNHKLDALPQLTDIASWQYWKSNIGYIHTPPEFTTDAALFLHCAIAKARANGY